MPIAKLTKALPPTSSQQLLQDDLLQNKSCFIGLLLMVKGNYWPSKTSSATTTFRLRANSAKFGIAQFFIGHGPFFVLNSPPLP